MPIPTTLRLGRWCASTCGGRDTLYRLRGMVVHRGYGSTFGHYVAYVHASIGDCRSGGARVGWGEGGGGGGGEEEGVGGAATAPILSTAAEGVKEGVTGMDVDGSEDVFGEKTATGESGTSATGAGATSAAPRSWVLFDDCSLSRVSAESMAALLAPEQSSTATPYLVFYEAE